MESCVLVEEGTWLVILQGVKLESFTEEVLQYLNKKSDCYCIDIVPHYPCLHSGTQNSAKRMCCSWEWWHTAVILAAWESRWRSGGSQFEASLGKKLARAPAQ
jgi:phosphohistidine phosphatase SixA